MTAARQRSFSVKTPRESHKCRTTVAGISDPARSRARHCRSPPGGRHPVRDATLILLMYRHGFRSAKPWLYAGRLSTSMAGCLHVHRLKNGQSAVHPLRGPELRALRQVRRPIRDAVPVCLGTGRATDRPRGAPYCPAGWAGRRAHVSDPSAYAPACLWFYLANKGIDTRAIQQYLGHCNIQHTVRYTRLTPQRFTALWDD